MPVRSLGHRIGTAWGAAVSKSGTSLVAFQSKGSLTIARRTEQASKFKISARLLARKPEVLSLTALENGRFLLIYTVGQRLLARGIDGAGHFTGSAHVLSAGSTAFVSLPLVAVESNASRTVVVWGLNDKTTDRIRGAIDDQAGWSGAKLLYSVKSGKTGPFFLQAVSDSQDRFLVSLQGEFNSTTALMWGLASASRQWEPVTPPQTTDNSALAEQNGATLASVNGVITAAWQDASGALVVSTWDGSTWTTPVRAVAGSESANGSPVVIYSRFVSDGSRAAIVWEDEASFGPLQATIRASSEGGWSAPLTVPHSRNDPNSFDSYQEPFWFAPSGALAGIWIDSNFPKLASPPTLYAGTVSGNAGTATALGKTQNPESARSWFVLPRAARLHTIVWANINGREFSATATANGAIQQKQSFPACADPRVAASNPDAQPQVVSVTPIGDSPATSGPKCPALLLW